MTTPGGDRRRRHSVAAAIVLLAAVASCARHDESLSPLTSATVAIPTTTTMPTPVVTSVAASTTIPETTSSPPSTSALTTRSSVPETSQTTTSAPPLSPTTPPAPTSTIATTVLPGTTVTTSTTVSAAPAEVVWIGDTSQQEVALTFDAGSDAGSTSAILDALGAYGIRAAFALTGEWVEQNPSLARRIVAEGHVVMNHSYDHPSFTGVSSDDAALTTSSRWDQLDRAEQVIRSVTGATSLPYFRPPFGDQDASVARDAGARGYRFLVMWTVDSLGWQGRPAPDVVTRCVERAEPGAIMLFHVGSASTDATALPDIIEHLRAHGYRFVAFPELLD